MVLAALKTAGLMENNPAYLPALAAEDGVWQELVITCGGSCR
jgi:hypothetical protein